MMMGLPGVAKGDRSRADQRKTLMGRTPPVAAEINADSHFRM
jgi:hypothetical protein